MGGCPKTDILTDTEPAERISAFRVHHQAACRCDKMSKLKVPKSGGFAQCRRASLGSVCGGSLRWMCAGYAGDPPTMLSLQAQEQQGTRSGAQRVRVGVATVARQEGSR